MRKVYLDVNLKVIVRLDEGITVTDFIENFSSSMNSSLDIASEYDIEDIHVAKYEITDSK